MTRGREVSLTRLYVCNIVWFCIAHIHCLCTTKQRQFTSVLTTAMYAVRRYCTVETWYTCANRGREYSTPHAGVARTHADTQHLVCGAFNPCPSQPAAVQSATHVQPQPPALCRGHRPLWGGQMRQLSPFECHHHDIAGCTPLVYTHLVPAVHTSMWTL